MQPTRLRATLTALALLPVLAWTLFPIYWVTTASFKTELALYARPPQWLFTPILDNYTRVLTNIPFFQYLKNSLVVAIGTTVGSLVLGTLAGYGFARFRFRGSEAVRFLVLVTRMAPRMVLVVPYYLMMQRLGLLDTYTGLLRRLRLVRAAVLDLAPHRILRRRAAGGGGGGHDRRLLAVSACCCAW